MISISSKIPANGEKNIELGSLIEFVLIDDGTGIDISKLIIEINGVRAYADSSFGTGFDGPFSEVTPDGENYIVVIDKEDDFSQGLTVGVKVQIQNLSGTFSNDLWAFRTVPAEPQVISISPYQDEEIETPQFIYIELEDIIDGVNLSSITLSINGLNYVVAGSVVPDINSSLSSVTATTNGAIIRIDPIETLRQGDYTISYTASDTNSNAVNGTLRFSVAKNITLPAEIKQIGFTGFFQGIKKTSDLGTGDSINVEWHKPIVRSANYESFLLVYKNASRLDIFDSQPSFIAPSSISKANITALVPGDTLSYAVRAMEATLGTWNLTGMYEMDTGLYIIPENVTVTHSVTSTGLRIRVSSTDGWPESALIRIGNEILRYSSILSESNSLIIEEGERGLFGSSIGTYISGDEVSLFVGCQDENTVILMATPSYHDGYQSGREINSTGIIVPDFSDNDRVFFEGYDFCGYHSPMPQEVLQGKTCGSYLGGDSNGWRGMNLYDRMLEREEVLLDQTGEPIVLLRRIWDGEKCTCASSRKDHPKVKSCHECFGTTYVGGYQQYINMRRKDRRVMLSFKEATEDLKHGDHEQLQQEFEPTAWGLPMPSIKDRDVLIRFDYTDDVEYIYEVLDSSREKHFYRHFGRQNLKLKRMDKTDILYTLIKSAIIDNSLLPTIK